MVSFIKDGPPMVFPAYPQLKLRPDSARHLGEKPDLVYRINPSEVKYGLKIREGYSQNPIPLCSVYVLDVSDTKDFSLKPLFGVEKISALIANTYRPQFLEGLDVKTTHFRQCAAAAQHGRVSLLTRPKEPFRLRELVMFLEKDFFRYSP
jgi:hypothetical protein